MFAATSFNTETQRDVTARRRRFIKHSRTEERQILWLQIDRDAVKVQAHRQTSQNCRTDCDNRVMKSLSDSARFWRCGEFQRSLIRAQNQLHICGESVHVRTWAQHSGSGLDLTNDPILFQTAAILNQLLMKQKFGFQNVIYVPHCENTCSASL